MFSADMELLNCAGGLFFISIPFFSVSDLIKLQQGGVQLRKQRGTQTVCLILRASVWDKKREETRNPACRIDCFCMFICVWSEFSSSSGSHQVWALLIVDFGPWILIFLLANQIRVLCSGLWVSTLHPMHQVSSMKMARPMKASLPLHCLRFKFRN